MKKSLTTAFVLALLLAVSPAASAQSKRGATATVKQLTLTFELNAPPACDSPGSFWEVSYQWRIADGREFDRWSQGGEDPAKEGGVGSLIKKQSFRRTNLSNPEGRRFSVSVPVRGELLERLRNAGQRQQVVWLDAVVRIHNGELGTDILNKVNPAWGPYFYLDGNAVVRMELTAGGDLEWYTGGNPPRPDGERRGLKISSTPRPE